MITISKAYSFDSAHQLWRDDWSRDKNVEVFGKCSTVHGHTYRLEVYISGDVDPASGMVLNYFLLDETVKPLVERLDHKFLNDIFNNLTTSENMVADIAEWVNTALAQRYALSVSQVTLQETPKTKAVWVPERTHL